MVTILGKKNPRRKVKQVRWQCRFGCCYDVGNWKKYRRVVKLKQGVL